MKEKEANIPWVMQRTNKAPGQGLHCSQRHRAPSQRGLESPGKKSELRRFPRSRELARGREGERERDGDPSLWWSKGILMIFL